MILRAPDPRQIMIAVESIPDANILTAKKSLRLDDLIVRIETNGKKAYPVSNIEDGVIWAVLARINEWIIQDEQLRTKSVCDLAVFSLF